MSTVALVFPHQLFADSPVLAPGPPPAEPLSTGRSSSGSGSSVLREAPALVSLVEDSLFFGDARHPAHFHKQKLAYHRATMSAYRQRLETRGFAVEIVPCRADGESTLGPLFERIAADGHDRVVTVDPHDFLLGRRLRAAAKRTGLALAELATPAFINDPLDNRDWRETRTRWHMADFYRWQRERLDVLMDGDEPAGGRWSFDEENRKKLPKRERALLPRLPEVDVDARIRAAIDSVERDFPDNPGSLERWYYPIDSAGADAWLERFLDERLEKFGPYEDAIVAGESWLYHGVLTPMLNVGLLVPGQVVEAALEVAKARALPIASVEGFVRQVIGWREFMRATYDDLGTTMRTTNRWRHSRPMPACFYDASTGIAPVDDAIRRALDTGYCHHIERLMVLGGFMFLCEIDPDDIYTWFMEMFIDGYDWVMVPNVYAMSQHADGGAITTKPYFCGSNYVLKMSDHAKGDWCATWDALFWRWIVVHADALAGNRRWSMMVANARRMDEPRKAAHLATADAFLESLERG